MLKVGGEGMIRRRVVLRWACCGAGTLLWGCGSDEKEPPPPPPPPTVVSLTLQAAPDVNPTEAGEARPVAVRVLRLASVDDFLETGFFELDSDAKGVLGGDLIGEDAFTLAPGDPDLPASVRRRRPLHRRHGGLPGYRRRQLARGVRRAAQ